MCSKFTGEHPCGSLISTKLQNSFIEVTLSHWCSTVNLLYICKTPIHKNIFEGLLPIVKYITLISDSICSDLLKKFDLNFILVYDLSYF